MSDLFGERARFGPSDLALYVVGVMSVFGAPSDKPPRWVAVLVIAAALAGVALGVWVFAAIT